MTRCTKNDFFRSWCIWSVCERKDVSKGRSATKQPAAMDGYPIISTPGLNMSARRLLRERDMRIGASVPPRKRRRVQRIGEGMEASDRDPSPLVLSPQVVHAHGRRFTKRKPTRLMERTERTRRAERMRRTPRIISRVQCALLNPTLSSQGVPFGLNAPTRHSAPFNRRVVFVFRGYVICVFS